MVSDKMAKALNAQLNFELYSAYVYLAMSAHADSVGLKGFANWFNAQYQEEMMHAMKFFNYIMDRAEVELEQIDKPRKEYKDALEMFEETLKHEQEVTARINELATLAIDEKDHATNTFLQWFINEQVEEEATVKEILDKLKLAGATGPGLFMVNNELGTRTFAPPADANA
ncbi:MAG: ferritin [Denitrovibrio sp.]|nr:MAG: ferritin [Denitrovibrio sp.]